MMGVLILVATLVTGSISGTVQDSTGAVIAGATVVVRDGSSEQRTVSGPDGRFTIDVPASGQVTLIVRAQGFAEKQQPAASGAENVTVELAPASLLEDVTVTASRTEQRLGDQPASISVLREEDIRQSPAVVADDVLRQIPTFSLFRRASSLASHPTTQGVSLRGIGPSGVSRTLVLLDGIPFNDPFGGWVYWTRVPLESTDRIEVVEGSSSSLYGNYAMGGVINIATSRAARRTVELKPQYGNRNSPKFDFFGSDVWGKVGASVQGSFFDTDGFPNVIENERGKIDTNNTVNFKNVSTKLDYSPNARLNGFFRYGYFREKRDNGKVSTFDGTPEANDTTWNNVSGGVRAVLPDESDLQASVFGDFETFRSNFLAVPAATPPRSVGRMTLNQEVPTTGAGAMVQWSKALKARNFFSAGFDWRWVDGDSNEDALDAQRGLTVTLHRVSGGTQQSAGVFLQDIYNPINKLQITLAGRLDHWRNYDAHNLETNVPSGTPGPGNNPSLPDRDDTVFSPRVGALYHASDRVSVWGAIGAGFRAPTLNELYRQFRVGTTLTLANNQLGPERLVGGEGGVNFALLKDVIVRFTAFDNHIDNPIANVTIATTPAQVTQQRQNLGKTRITGFQSDIDYRLNTFMRVSGGYLYNHAIVKEFAANPLLATNCPGRPGEACFLPQVPENRGSLRFAYSNPRYLTATVGVEVIGRQYDDDQNSRVVPGETEPGLPAYAVVDFTASRVITRNVEVFFGAENLFDQQYIVGTLPTLIGSPRFVNAGLRLRFSGR